MFHTWVAGANFTDGSGGFIHANGDQASVGWPNSAQVEAEIAAWYEAQSLDQEKAAMRRLNKVALDHVVYAPTGFFLQYQAWRKNVRAART
jgi:peptide/nickel transport system substrate-binding protein